MVTLTFCVMNLPKVQQKPVIMLKKFMCPKRIYTLVLLVTIAVKIAVRVYLRTIWLRFYKK